VTLVVRMVVIVITGGLFANIDHTVITAVVVAISTTTTSLGNRITRAQLAARAAVLVLADTAAALIVVRVLVGFRATDNIVLGFSGWLDGY
jgi:hypothetical protein